MKKAQEIKQFLESIYYESYEVQPDSSTIIFLHDSLGCTQLWRDFPRQMASYTGFNTLSYDRQGYGKSCPFTYSQRDDSYLSEEADILITLMDHWNIEKAILFGHSDGGSIALLAAAKYPDRIEAIITEGAHIFVEDITLKGIESAIYAYQHTALKSRLEKYHGEKTEALFWAWAGTWNLPIYANWNIEIEVRKIKCPSLIIQGTNDEFGSMAQVYQIIAQTAGTSEGLILPNIGHNPHKEIPERILSSSKMFLNHYLG